MVGVFLRILENKSAQNGLKIGSSRYSGLLITNPALVFLSDFVGTDQTVINVFLEVNMAESGSEWPKTRTLYLFWGPEHESVIRLTPRLHLVFAVSELTVINVFLEVNMAPNGLKLA